MIGTKRYKPLLISCLVVIFSITGITIVASTLSSSSPDAASKIGQDSNPTKNSQQQSTSLNGLEQKPTKDNTSQNQPNGQSGTSSDQKQANGSGQTPDATLEVSLNTAMVSLSQTSPTTAVAVTTTDGSNVQWSITPAPESVTSGVNARIEQSKDNAANAAIRFRADNITPGTYQFIVTAKDAARSLSASKTITVTVN
jgi:hypothetical protein